MSDLYSLLWKSDSSKSKFLSAEKQAVQFAKTSFAITCKLGVSTVLAMNPATAPFAMVGSKMVCVPAGGVFKDVLEGEEISIGKIATEVVATGVKEFSMFYNLLDKASIIPHLLHVGIHTLKSAYDYYSSDETRKDSILEVKQELSSKEAEICDPIEIDFFDVKSTQIHTDKQERFCDVIEDADICPNNNNIWNVLGGILSEDSFSL
ncbi:MAG: hypothetical protein HRU36_05785 [Rickettsiales bacterium]|nr:hypothetical protein [Rickettsiales bacterium]